MRSAIASYGKGGNFSNNRLDRLVERLGLRVLLAPNALALGNLFRRKGRLSLTQFDVALDYQYNLQAVLVWLVTVVIISILASVLPARNATTISVRESLAYA